MKKLVYIIAIIGVLIDQISKILVDRLMNLGENISIIPNFFSIRYIRNTGAAWGMFSNNTFILAIVSLIFLSFVIKYINENSTMNKLNIISFGFIVGGIIGNLIDRLLRRFVIDFFSFNIFGYYFPIFNIADVLIVVAVIFLIIDSFIGGDKVDSRRREKKN